MKRRPDNRLHVTSGYPVPWFGATDNLLDHIVDIQELFLQEFRSVTLLPLRDDVQEEFILGNVDEILIAGLEEVLRREILADNGLDIIFREEFFRSDVDFVSIIMRVGQLLVKLTLFRCVGRKQH